MNEKIEIIKLMYVEQREMARHHENQRATIANLILVLSGGAMALITEQKFSKSSIPLSIFIILIGIYGVYAIMKSYERSKFHLMRSSKYREKLNELIPEAEIIETKVQSDEIHKKQFPFFYKVRMNKIWILLFIGVIFIGAATLIISLIKN